MPPQKASLRPPDRDVLAAQELDPGWRQRTRSRPGGTSAKTRRSWPTCVWRRPNWCGWPLTSRTGRTLRLWLPKLHLLSEVNPNGVRFLDAPEAFQEELLRQAQELHCGHEGLSLDLLRLQAPVRPGDPAPTRTSPLACARRCPGQRSPGSRGPRQRTTTCTKPCKSVPRPRPSTSCRGLLVLPCRAWACMFS